MGDLMQINWLSEKGRICAQGIVPRWAAVTAGMCRIPLICLGWEKISVVQTSPRPAASTLQALRIGKYLEGHLIKPLHSALFTPSPKYKHILHSFYTFKNFLDFSLFEMHKCFLWCSNLTPPINCYLLPHFLLTSLLIQSSHIWQCGCTAWSNLLKLLPWLNLSVRPHF